MHILSMFAGAFAGMLLLFGTLSAWFFVCSMCFNDSDEAFLIGIGAFTGVLVAALVMGLYLL